MVADGTEDARDDPCVPGVPAGTAPVTLGANRQIHKGVWVCCNIQAPL